MGLTVSREIITAMGGKFDITSKIGEGTNCTVQIPLQKVKGELVIYIYNLFSPKKATADQAD